MLVPKSLPKSKLFILIFLVVLTLGFTIYLVYTKIFVPKGILVFSFTPKIQIELYEGDVRLPDAKGFDTNFFEREGIRDFKNYANLPVVPKTPGSINPFIPLITPKTTNRSGTR